MGRRKSFLGTLVREMEKSANRAAAEGRRQNRRVEAVQGRALEREMVRYERAQERDRVRSEREAERRRIAEERERAQQRKQEAKESQLRGWQLEYEEHQEREQDIERIANDAPEVEDRDRLHAQLAERRVFEPLPFVAPEPPNTDAKVRKLRKDADQEAERAVASFQPRTREARLAQIAAGVVGIIGLGLSFSEAKVGSLFPLVAILVGLIGVGIAQLVAMMLAQGQRKAHKRKVRDEVDGRLDKAISTLVHEDEVRTKTTLQKARATYEAETETARAEFELMEDRRLQELSELRAGSTSQIKEALDTSLPLELPVSCAASFVVQSSTVISLDIDVPEPSVLSTTEAKLLASGKVAYKEKNDKRIRDQYMRLVAGLALRHASEIMLLAPTCQRIELRAFRSALEPSLGRPERRSVLEVQFDYPTLAPMTMDGIDPVAALKHFQHRINVDRNRDLRALDTQSETARQ